MYTHYLHLHLPRRGPLYIGLGVWLIVMYILELFGAPAVTIFGLCLSLIIAGGFVLNDRAAGMEIRDGEWRFFLGDRHWSVPLTHVASVRVLGPRHQPVGLVLQFRNGETDILPRNLAPRIAPLERFLEQRGIPLMG